MVDTGVILQKVSETAKFYEVLGITITDTSQCVIEFEEFLIKISSDISDVLILEATLADANGKEFTFQCYPKDEDPFAIACGEPDPWDEFSEGEYHLTSINWDAMYDLSTMTSNSIQIRSDNLLGVQT